jgi:hypothetical protein
MSIRVLRWILLPIVFIAAWIAALFTGIVAHAVAEFFCPSDRMVSGMCVAPWFETLNVWLIRFFSAMAAALVIVSCYFTAPAARTLVAWVVLAVGGIYALWIATVSWAWPEFIAAGVGGIATVLVLMYGASVSRKPVVLHNTPAN